MKNSKLFLCLFAGIISANLFGSEEGPIFKIATSGPDYDRALSLMNKILSDIANGTPDKQEKFLKDLRSGKAKNYFKKPFLAQGIVAHCENCFAVNPLFRCTGCYTAVYCGKSCQTEDRHEHKLTCVAPEELLKRMKEGFKRN